MRLEKNVRRMVEIFIQSFEQFKKIALQKIALKVVFFLCI